MTFYSRLRSVVRNLSGQARVEKQLDDKIGAYAEMMAEERMEAGMSAAEARRAVQMEAGGMEQVKQAVRDRRAGTGLQSLGQDVRFGLRQLRRNPGFTVFAIAALALGIGANAAIFSVVNTVLLKPLSYPDAERMVHFYLGPPSHKFGQVNIPEFHLLQAQSGLFSEVAAYDVTGPGFNLTGDHPEQLHGLHVTQGYFQLFGAQAILGRTFTPQEDLPHGGKAVVLSYGLWQRKFGGDPAVLGRSLSLGNDPYTIVGVLGKEFLSDPEADVWVPFQFEPESDDLTHDFQAAALLKPGIPIAQAEAQMKVLIAEFRRIHPNYRQELHVEPLRDTVIGDAQQSLVMMLGAVGLVLLIACANVANLVMVRATGRRREFAIRSALGASRGRIVRQLLIESVLISMTGGGLGLGLGFLGVRGLLAISPGGLARIGEGGAGVGIDWWVLGFTLAVAHVRTMDEVMGHSTARQSFNMMLLTIFGAVALLLAAIGIYGLMAYTVAQRTREIGIRMALGADRSAIRRMVVWQGMRLALVGVAGGLVAAFGLTRLLSSFLFGVRPWDPAVFVTAPLILSAIALFAVWLPATRAAKVDPLLALRAE